MHILLAEDNTISQLFFRKISQKKGWKIDIANNGIEALQLASENQYDCIMMDIEMPLLGGIEATITLRKRNITIPIIALTANITLGEDKSIYSKAGMDEYLLKPCKPETIYMMVEKLVGHS